MNTHPTEAPRPSSPRDRRAREGARTALAFLLVLVVCSPPCLAGGAWAEPGAFVDDDEPVIDGAAQFATLCARCHGLTGDGQGPEVLERPARDFTAGGFSFGNTQDAIARTITYGIPGSPMPSFGEALEPDVIEALAQHVRALAPGTEEPAEAETILTVRDHPQAVRGGLPPIAEGADAHPRGLLLGLPDGLTFEYRVTDLALLGVRTGEFVRRADWTGRGGSSLEPLGQLVWLNERGSPRAAAALSSSMNGDESSAPLVAELRATRAPPEGASVLWDAHQPDGTLVAHIDEQLRAVQTPYGGGFVRVLRVTGPRSQPLVLHHAASPGQLMGHHEGPGHVLAKARDDGRRELVVSHVDWDECTTASSADGIEVTLPARAAGNELPVTLTFLTLLAPEDAEPMDPEGLYDALLEELLR